LYNVYSLLNLRIIACVIFAAISTWFHFLVAGWFFLILLIYFCMQEGYGKKLGRATKINIATVLPLMLYLASIYFIDNPVIVIKRVGKELYTPI